MSITPTRGPGGPHDDVRRRHGWRLRILVTACLGLGWPSVLCAERADPPRDFALRLEYGTCTTDVIDTFSGEYARDLGDGHIANAPFRLTRAQATQLHRLVVSSGILSYPGTYRPAGQLAVEPHEHFRLVVRSRGATHAVAWDDIYHAVDLASSRLRETLYEIIGVIVRIPAVKRLPAPNVSCL